MSFLNAMASFSQRLPPELWLDIVLYLSIPDIHAFQRAFKPFDALVRLNESFIYRGAAIQHGFASNAVSDIQEVTTSRKRRFDWLSGVRTWLHYCACGRLRAFRLFINAPRQATYGDSKKLVSERPCCPLYSLGLRSSPTPNQDRRRGGEYNHDSRAGYDHGALRHVDANKTCLSVPYISRP